MKKVFLMFAVVLVANFTTSCSNETGLDTTVEPVEQSESCEMIGNSELRSLNANIENFNMERFGVKPLFQENLSTRFSLKKFFSSFCSVLWADAKGGLNGLFTKGETFIGGACGASAAKVIEIVETEINEATPKPTRGGHQILCDTINMANFVNDNILEESIAYETEKCSLIDSAGYFHNKVILNLFEKHNTLDFWTDLTTIELVQIINEEVEKELNLPKGSLTNDMETNNLIVKEIEETKGLVSEADFEEYIAEIRNENPTLADLIIVIANYVNGIAEEYTLDNSKEYTNIIMNMINESEVDEKSKQALKIGVNIAFASSQLWNRECLE